MITQPHKVFQGVATRQQMFHLFDRHAQAPMSKARYSGRLYDGEWFEIGRAEHDYMFEILPPLWMRGDAFAMREFMAGAITSVFFTLSIGGRIRRFHSYCDLTARGSVEAMRLAILDRESTPIATITRDEQLDHVWSTASADFRGYAGDGWREADRGKRTILVNAGAEGTVLTLLESLSEADIKARMPAVTEQVAA